MEKNKEDGMTDLEIIKKNFNIITESEGYDYWYELEKEALAAATRMAAEIESLKNEVNETQVVYYSVLKENKQLKAALAEKPDIVRCGECKNWKRPNCPFFGVLGVSIEHDFHCAYNKRKEVKDED